MILFARSIAFFDHYKQYRSALEEWQSGRFIRRQFEVEKYMKTYTDIQDYILDLLEHHPHADRVANLLLSRRKYILYTTQYSNLTK